MSGNPAIGGAFFDFLSFFHSQPAHAARQGMATAPLLTSICARCKHFSKWKSYYKTGSAWWATASNIMPSTMNAPVCPCLQVLYGTQSGTVVSEVQPCVTVIRRSLWARLPGWPVCWCPCRRATCKGKQVFPSSHCDTVFLCFFNMNFLLENRLCVTV